jgi:hypothetical protein
VVPKSTVTTPPAPYVPSPRPQWAGWRVSAARRSLVGRAVAPGGVIGVGAGLSDRQKRLAADGVPGITGRTSVS